jgi:hypothetical protein
VQIQLPPHTPSLCGVTLTATVTVTVMVMGGGGGGDDGDDDDDDDNDDNNTILDATYRLLYRDYRVWFPI